MVVVNLDLILLTNLIFTGAMFWFVGKLWGEELASWRIFIAALVSSLYLILVLFISWPKYLFLLGHLILSFFMVLLVWGKRNILQLGKYFLSVYGVAFFFGGLALAFWNGILNHKNKSIPPLILLAILVLVAYLGTKVYGLFVRWQENKGYYSLRITFINKSITLMAYLDTGHKLKGMSGEDVIVVTWRGLESLLREFPATRKLKEVEDLLNLSDQFWQKRVRLVPYRAIGTEWGSLVALVPDRVELLGLKKETLNNIILAIYDGPIHGRCQALLPKDLEKQIHL